MSNRKGIFELGEDAEPAMSRWLREGIITGIGVAGVFGSAGYIWALVAIEQAGLLTGIEIFQTESLALESAVILLVCSAIFAGIGMGYQMRHREADA